MKAFSSIRHRAAALLALGVIAAAPAPAPAQSQATLTEAQAKAAMVLNFARYVDWPATAFASVEAPVVACVWGRESVTAALTALESRPVRRRVLSVRRVAAAEQLHGCHVVFIGETEARHAVPVLRALVGLPVLTVGDGERFIDVGGMIGIVQGDERLQFEINRPALDQAQLKASASLLKLARNLP